jgi:hypothetical protein
MRVCLQGALLYFQLIGSERLMACGFCVFVQVTLEALCTMLYDMKKAPWEDIRKRLRGDDFLPSIMSFDTNTLKASKSKIKSVGAFYALLAPIDSL